MANRTLSDESNLLFRRLQAQLTELYVRWKLYRQLVAKNQSRIDLLNEMAGSFFARVSRVLLDDVLLGIARLNDPAGTAGKQNFSFRLLLESLSAHDDATVAAQVEEHVQTLDGLTQSVREHRNKRIAHFDLRKFMNPTLEPLSSVSREDIERILSKMSEVLNAVQVCCEDSATGYEHVVTDRDGDTLVEGLKLGYVMHELLKNDRVLWHSRIDDVLGRSGYLDA